MLVFAVVAMAASAQYNKPITLTVDTLKGNNNKILDAITVQGTYANLFLSVKVTRKSAAAGGTLFLKAGKDAASALVVNHATNPQLICSPNDTLATADVATQYWNIVVPNPGELYYEIYGDGDANDTIIVTTTYSLKK